MSFVNILSRRFEVYNTDGSVIRRHVVLMVIQLHKGALAMRPISLIHDRLKNGLFADSI